MIDHITISASVATTVGFLLTASTKASEGNAESIEAVFGPVGLKLIELFGQAGVFLGFILFLLKVLREQYDSRIALQEKRIEAAEDKINECEKDRRAIHNTLESVRQEQLRELRQMHAILTGFPVVPRGHTAPVPPIPRTSTEENP